MKKQTTCQKFWSTLKMKNYFPHRYHWIDCVLLGILYFWILSVLFYAFDHKYRRVCCACHQHHWMNCLPFYILQFWILSVFSRLSPLVLKGVSLISSVSLNGLFPIGYSPRLEFFRLLLCLWRRTPEAFSPFCNGQSLSVVPLEFANGFRSFGYWHISFSFLLTLVVSLFFPCCFIFGGRGRGGAALRVRGWCSGGTGGAGRTGIGLRRPD